MRLNVFTVYMPLSAYVMRAIDMHLIKGHLLTYLVCVLQFYCLFFTFYLKKII